MRLSYATKKPSAGRNCAITATGDFGDVSNTNNGLSVGFNYELIVNATKVNMTGSSISSVMNKVELAITDALLRDLFSNCASNAANGSRRALDSSNSQVIGISSRHSDIISLDNCDVSNLSSDSQCYVVISRLTIFATNPSDSSSLIQSALSIISRAMESGDFASANDEIIKLIFVVPSDDKNILYIPSISPGQEVSEYFYHLC